MEERTRNEQSDTLKPIGEVAIADKAFKRMKLHEELYFPKYKFLSRLPGLAFNHCSISRHQS